MGKLGKRRKNLHYPLWLILSGAMLLLGLVAGPAAAALPGEPGNLLSYQLVENYPPDGFSVRMYAITYDTPNFDGTMVVASGLVIIPDPASGKYALVSFHHGTMVKREEAPSYPQTCDYVPFLRQFAVTGSRCVVAMPDYIGMGHSPVRHPFSHADTEASACRDMLRATKELCSQLGVQLTAKLFLTGYSQGGGVTMALHRLLERDCAAEFPITASAPAGGPYDQIYCWNYGLQHPNTIWTPVAAYIMVAYNRIYKLSHNLDAIFQQQYANLADGLFDGTHTEDEIIQKLPATVQEMLRPDFIEQFNRGEGPAYLAWVANNTNDWRPRAPMRLYHARGDECVPYAMAEQTQARMRSLGAEVGLVDVGDFEHIPAFFEALPLIKKWFDSFFPNPAPINSLLLTGD